MQGSSNVREEGLGAGVQGIPHHRLTGKAYKSLAWGNFLNSVINFVIIAFVVFWIVKVYKKSTKRDLAQDGPSEVDLLTEIRDELKSRG